MVDNACIERWRLRSIGAPDFGGRAVVSNSVLLRAYISLESGRVAMLSNGLESLPVLGWCRRRMDGWIDGWMDRSARFLSYRRPICQSQKGLINRKVNRVCMYGDLSWESVKAPESSEGFLLRDRQTEKVPSPRCLLNCLGRARNIPKDQRRR
jgi:hypothetical protein